MNLKLKKFDILGIALLIDVMLQLLCIILNCFNAKNGINYFMYVNNYVIGVLIIASLMSKGISSHFLVASFFGCFMLFLMGQKPFMESYNVFLTFKRLKLDANQYLMFTSILFCGLTVTYYSYIFFYKRGNEKKPLVCFVNDEKKRPVIYIGNEDIKGKFRNIEYVLMTLFALSLPCALYMQAKIVFVRGGMMYTEGYLINVYVPGIIKAGYYIYSIVVLIYLTIKPKKIKLFIILSTYLVIEGGMQLFQGRRALFAGTVLFIVWYLFKYYDIKSIKMKYYFWIGLIFTALIIVFYVVEQARDRNSTQLAQGMVSKFLVSTGGSDSVIANTIHRKDDFPAAGVLYLIDPLLNNIVGNFILGKPSSAQGLTYLQQHNSFEHWISYLTEPSLYLSGHGMGSCYLAEIYLAFGIIGVVLFSVLIGWILARLNKIRFDSNIYRNSVILFIVRNVFTLPRSGLFSWVGNIPYLIFVFLLIYPFYFHNYKTKKKLTLVLK